ncbi:hypothetical protein P22_1110 [Propionispora sp. 2/2-37]|uniref:hypothetical protein n=1 Tax=Propionispora sp. 2/2-37 TaxID=1677858 RepID=UPI0006BB8C4B|nr:hypothetical protein [Propionispora sp. 2/2-37]CUH95041.1 hypothetical protein P22_1110 [Propionispora sp. 2/2-37]
MNLSTRKKLVSGLIIGCLALSLGSLAFADEMKTCPPPQAENEATCRASNHPGGEKQLSDSLTKLVTEGTITQEQADKIQTFFKEKAAERQAAFEKMKKMTPEQRQAYLKKKSPRHSDLINDLKSAAGLSQEQAQVVAETLRPPRPFPPQERLQQIDTTLAQLVQQGTITQEQADELVQFFKEKAAEHKAEFEKTRDMTPEERQAFLKGKMPQQPDFINDLKNAAGLSDKQVRAVAAALHPPHGPHHADCNRPAGNQ